MHNPDFNSEVETKTEIKTQLPSFYKVVIHNDDKTTFDFVIALLIQIFHKTPEAAFEITLSVHKNGRGVAGLYTKEVAHEKTKEANNMAKANNFPLKITYEVD
jgi:ATP-dependent Clp protease adaptor protein ClpS